MQRTCHLALYARLEPLTAWAGGRLAETDLLTIDEAARMATRHAGTEVTPADFLLAAARGEIPLHATCPRSVTMQPTGADREPLHMPAGSLPMLPLSACKGLSVAGRARWRTCDAHERLEAFAGEWGYYTAWSLPDGEPDLDAVVTDCRVTGRDVHALADACTEVAPLPVPAEPEPTDALVIPTAPTDGKPVPDWKDQARSEARSIRKERAALGRFPGLKDLGNEVARHFRERGITGSNGHALTGAYIKRHALQGHGITTDTDRLKATLNTRGK